MIKAFVITKRLDVVQTDADIVKFNLLHEFPNEKIFAYLVPELDLYSILLNNTCLVLTLEF